MFKMFVQQNDIYNGAVYFVAEVYRLGSYSLPGALTSLVNHSGQPRNFKTRKAKAAFRKKT